ncbi:hypothetical protein [Pseudacidovorax intermedius]|uniref:hypothetical protein n=1 Tax=Pseudacidovorax intermedius TaxID=433924 RepID=UPI0026EED342|nr:hypothetical protein [Pseudacidovorax intermedius]
MNSQPIQGTTAATTGTERSAPPGLTGGEGFSYEDTVAAVYAVALLGEAPALGLTGRTVIHVAVQQGPLGQPLDDLVVRARGVDQSVATFSAQVKESLRISAADTNTDFRETIERAYRTVSAPGFQVGQDRVGAITGQIADASRRTFETLCEWARDESSTEVLVRKLRTPGVAGDKTAHFDVVREILTGNMASEQLDTAVHKLLAHFVLIRMGLLAEGSVTENKAVTDLANMLAPADRGRADDLWRRLLSLVRRAEGRAAGFDRKTLVARLNGAYRLAGAPSLSGALQSITRETRLALDEIENNIHGLNIPRDSSVNQVVQAVGVPGLLQVSGLPGVGKSVVLRLTVERLLQLGPVLLLKADRLQGSTWAQYAAASGLPNVDLEELLVELGATGPRALFIDGLDRIEVARRGVLKDVLHSVLNSPLLSDWLVVATVRDTGAEPLRTWLPAKLFSSVRTVEVKALDDAEVILLAEAVPPLAPLLFGGEAVRSVVRRPFFAAVLAKSVGAGQVTASSEVDLAQLWWGGGGYSADAARAQHRRAALVGLAREGAARLGRRISVGDIDPQALVELEADGIIRPQRLGHSVQFTHDIFFEWAFLQLLVGEEERWPDVMRQVGEPPALGRVVELLSQAELLLGENWVRYLQLLESNTQLRSQWLRAWLAGPFGLETFAEHAGAYTEALFEGDARRVRQLVVWYQAAKSQPDSSVLTNANATDLNLAQRMLYADMLSYPADLPAWVRFCTWLLEHSVRVPVRAIPDVVAAFEVWQNRFRHRSNRVSDPIVRTCLAWLYHIQHVRYRQDRFRDYGVWRQLSETGYGDDELKELEKSLRSLVLRSTFGQPELVTQYIRDLQHLGRMPPGVLTAVFNHAPLLSQVCPTELVDLTLKFLRRRLPVDIERQVRDEEHSRISRGFSSLDRDALGMSDEGMFLPSAPTRQPFAALFEHAPDEARRLVRELSNHSIRAWRQFHRLSRDEGTPIPVVLDFPWGRQVFWGDYQRYMGARGNWAPAAVNSGLMALEVWAFAQLEAGMAADDVIRAVLEGHTSVGALAVAVAVSLQAQHCSAVTLPIATNQRLWHLDVRRSVEDLRQSNLIGFLRPHDMQHRRAVDAGNKLAVRREELRSLACLMLVRGGELRPRAAAAIQQFPNDLPFEFVEERASEVRRNTLRRTAEIWAENGKPENYRAELVEGEAKIAIVIDNPQSRSADVQEVGAKHAEMGRRFELLTWAGFYFDKGTLKPSLTIDEAVAAAKKLYVEDLFNEGHTSDDPLHHRQAAVAGVAAVVVSEGESEHYEWAAHTCVCASTTPHAHDELFVRQAHLMFHPVLYAANGLGALLKTAEGEGVPLTQQMLIRLACHPYEDIQVTALKGMLQAWDIHPEIAWEALRVATELALVEVRYGQAAEEARHKYLEDVLTASMNRVIDGAAAQDVLPSLPEPWVPIPPADMPRAVTIRFRRQRNEPWRTNPLQVDTTFLAKVLETIPVEKAVADQRHAGEFLAWCERLATWTVERVAPSWTTNRQSLEENASYLYDWKRNLFQFLARVSLQLPAAEAERRFLQKATAADDETYCELAEGYVWELAAAVTDGATIPKDALQLLAAARDRALQSWDENGRVERELADIARELFFSVNLRAKAPVRFANNKWSDVGVVSVLVDPILRAQGNSPLVAELWMQLCERSVEHYPVDHFVSSLQYVLPGANRRAQWRGSELPARLAGLIQRFSEKVPSTPHVIAQTFLRALDQLVDMGDRRASAVQQSEVFRSVRLDAAAQ